MSKDLQPPSNSTTPCALAEEAILATLDDEATPEQQALLAQHLVQCLPCRSYQTSMQHLTQSIQELDEVPVPKGLQLRIMDRIATEMAAPSSQSLAEPNDNLVDFSKAAPSRQNHRLKLMPIAAAILTVALSLPLIYQAINPGPERPTETTQTASSANPQKTILTSPSTTAFSGRNTGAQKAESDTGEEATLSEGTDATGSIRPANAAEEIASASTNLEKAYASNKEGDIYFDPLSNVVDF